MRYFDSNTYGDVLSRITNDVDTISNALQQSFSQVVVAILMVTLAISMMFSIHVVLALVALLIIPISIVGSRLLIHKSQKLFIHQQNALGELGGEVEEMYTGFSEIKLYGRQRQSLEKFKEVNGRLCENGFKAQFISGLMSPLVSFVTYLGIGTVAVLLGRLGRSESQEY